MQKKILPVDFPPKSKLYNCHIYSTATMDINYIYSNYIQLCLDPEDKGRCLNYYPSDFTFSGWPYVGPSYIDDEMLTFDDKLIIEKLIDWIDKDNYISICLPEFLLPGTQFYNQHVPIENIFVYLHDVFIYGYNKEKEIFKIICFDQSKELSIIDVSFNDLYNAYNSEEIIKAFEFRNNIYPSGKRFDIKLFKILNKEKKYNISKERIKEHLEHYLNSKDSSHFFAGVDHQQEMWWGIDVYKKIKSLILEDYYIFDYKMFYGIWEHKIIMKDRIEYLIQNNIITDFDYLESIEEIINITEKLKKISVKTVVTKTRRYAQKMIDLLEIIYIKEQDFISNFINAIN